MLSTDRLLWLEKPGDDAGNVQTSGTLGETHGRKTRTWQVAFGPSFAFGFEVIRVSEPWAMWRKACRDELAIGFQQEDAALSQGVAEIFETLGTVVLGGGARGSLHPARDEVARARLDFLFGGVDVFPPLQLLRMRLRRGERFATETLQPRTQGSFEPPQKTSFCSVGIMRSAHRADHDGVPDLQHEVVAIELAQRVLPRGGNRFRHVAQVGGRQWAREVLRLRDAAVVQLTVWIEEANRLQPMWVVKLLRVTSVGIDLKTHPPSIQKPCLQPRVRGQAFAL
mmetsp:Transcript_73306/g.203338  ORF Transcript_73306/g.203338 Transcript_73306/m.203338 type:complete len:282 (+) Transcript_73306:481-1326(+)